MPATLSIQAILARPDSLCFPANQPYAVQFEEQGGRVVQLATGHHVVYGRHGRRLLLLDPQGFPLHECEWGKDPQGRDTLIRARVRLDWGEWVGIRPGGLINATTLNLSTKPGWQRLRADDLRFMAAQALRVPIDEVRFFYGDQDLVIGGGGIATIRHRKDALYVLKDGTFEQSTFMACMGAMHWAEIDFLPVVELFQSLLPGTGSAVFELIRGLYDDQNADRPVPRPLRYRGIPTYPSDEAFRLFSAFFTPQAPGGERPFRLFMDTPRSSEVTWLPAADSPRRYVGEMGRFCVTVKQEMIEKVTFADDGTGLSYVAPVPERLSSCERTVQTRDGVVILTDRGHRTELAVDPQWGPLAGREVRPALVAPVAWSDLFSGAPPQVSGREAFSAVLLYPDDASEIGELASQPFVVDHLIDVQGQDPALARKTLEADRVLVHLFDGAIKGCIDERRSRDYTVLYQSGPFAQKQAQALWNRFARADRLPWLRRIHLSHVTEPLPHGGPYDLVYVWMPFAYFAQPAQLELAIRKLRERMVPGGLAFVAGPDSMSPLLRRLGLVIESAQAVEDLESFQMHRSILPQARLKNGLTLYRLACPSFRAGDEIDKGA
jgi:hypothetical protein